MPTRLSSLPRAATTRRTAVGAALAGLAAVSGCDAGRGDGETGSGVSTAADPDSALVDRVVSEVTDLAGLVASVAGSYPRLARTVRPFRELHATHLEVLGAERSGGSAGHHSFDGAAAALRELRLREQRSQQRLVAASMAARSGDLARVLACMSAGTAQQLALLAPASTGEQAG